MKEILYCHTNSTTTARTASKVKYFLLQKLITCRDYVLSHSSKPEGGG